MIGRPVVAVQFSYVSLCVRLEQRTRRQHARGEEVERGNPYEATLPEPVAAG